MGLRVTGDGETFVVGGEVAGRRGEDVAVVNRFLAHLQGRNFARATRRAYAYDMLNFLRFLIERGVALADVRPTDLFDYLDWQSQPKRAAGSTVVRFAEWRGAVPATLNRRIAAVRGLFEFAVITGVVPTSPVPIPRRTSGLRARRGLLGHVPVRHPHPGGRLVREQRRLPESLGVSEVEAFLADVGTHRDRAMVLLMLLGGLRAGEVRALRLADVDIWAAGR
jgi:integrase